MRGLSPLLLLALTITLNADIPEYHVYCSEDEFQYMNTNWEEEIEIQCTVIRGDTVYSGCTIRIRGDSSRGFPKKSYRITFQPTDPMDGRSKWNFNAEYLDRTYMHTWLYSRILGELDYPCFGVEYAMLFVNDNYRGLYLRCEPIDEQFLFENGLDPSGNLYKASIDGSCLSIWDDVEATWEKRTNENQGWNDLYELISTLEDASADSMVEVTGELFIFNDLLTMIAVNLLSSHLSTYYHNYWLHHDIWNTGRWIMLPWDVDKTFTDLFRPYHLTNNTNWQDNPLQRKVFLDPVFLDALFSRLNDISGTVFNNEVIDPLIDSLQLELAAAVESDTYDDTDLSGFIAASDSISSWFIPGRMSKLQYDYDHACHVFGTNRGETSGISGYFASWHPAFDPGGSDVTYTVTVSTAPFNADSVVAVYADLADTCLTITGLDPGTYYWSVLVPETGCNVDAYDRYNTFQIHQGTEIQGVLSGNTNLTSSESPYFVTGDITIPAGSFLLIEPGTELRFSENTKLTCHGYLGSNGNAQDSVIFCADIESEPWAGILVDGSGADLHFTRISGTTGYDEGSRYAALVLEYADLVLQNCSFSDNISCIRMKDGYADISECDVTGWNRGELFFMESGDGAHIRESAFGNLTDPPSSYFDGVEFQNCTSGEYLVEDCHIFNIEGDAIDCNNSIIVCSGNLVHDVLDKGFSIGAGTQGGVPSHAEITNAIIFNCEIGIAVKDAATAHIDRCTISDCATGVDLYQKTAGFGGGTGYISSSIIYDTSDPVKSDQYSTYTIDYSLTDTTEPFPGSGNITGNPFFLNYLGRDFHLMYYSPCIDTGNPELTDPDGTREDMGAVFFPQVLQSVCLNEVMSANQSTISDEWGEYADWLEIHNSSSWDADLSWVYLSDNPADPDRWRFPSGTVVPSGGYLIVWADGEPWKQGLHLPWRLSANNGDSLYLSVTNSEGSRATFSRIDEIVFGIIEPDSSYGRLPDGGEDWLVFSNPTPGYSNGGQGIVPGGLLAGFPFPNPCLGSLMNLDVEVENGWTRITVYDLAGRVIRTLNDSSLPRGQYNIFWDLLSDSGARVPNGIYLILLQHAGSLPLSRKVIVLSQ